MKITASKNLIVNGKRIKVCISKGPWIGDVDPRMIKVRPLRRSYFPAEIREALTESVENNSDSMIDYFEADCLRLLPGHALYADAQAAA